MIDKDNIKDSRFKVKMHLCINLTILFMRFSAVQDRTLEVLKLRALQTSKERFCPMFIFCKDFTSL